MGAGQRQPVLQRPGLQQQRAARGATITTPASNSAISVNDVYALIESTLSRTAADGQPSPRRTEVDTDASGPVRSARAAILPGVPTSGIIVSGRFKSRR